MLSSCFSVKPSTTKSGKKYFQTFYVGEEGTQYFIKPILFKNEESNEDLVLDITFRYRNELRDSAIVNFSVNSLIPYKTIDSLKLSNKNIVIKTDLVELIFNESYKSGFTSRYTTKFSLKEVKEAFNDDKWELTLYDQGKVMKYIPQKKTIKIINTIRNKVFVLM